MHLSPTLVFIVSVSCLNDGHNINASYEECIVCHYNSGVSVESMEKKMSADLEEGRSERHSLVMMITSFDKHSKYMGFEEYVVNIDFGFKKKAVLLT